MIYQFYPIIFLPLPTPFLLPFFLRLWVWFRMATTSIATFNTKPTVLVPTLLSCKISLLRYPIDSPQKCFTLKPKLSSNKKRHDFEALNKKKE